MSIIEDKQTSSIYANSAFSIQPKPIKQSMRVQYINQNLDQAVSQVKSHLKNKAKQKGKKSIVQNPQLMKDNGEKDLYFTETYRRKYKQRLKQLSEKKKEIEGKSLNKQINARLTRKIRDNNSLKDRMQFLKDLEEKKNESKIERLNRQKKKKEEGMLLHETSLDNIRMMRKNKLKTKNQELKESRAKHQESLKSLRFKTYLEEKQKQQNHLILKSKHQFMIRSHSTHHIGKSIQSNLSNKESEIVNNRQTLTSQRPRKKMLVIEREDDEDFIIKQYTPKKVIEQRVFNQRARSGKETMGQGEQEIQERWQYRNEESENGFTEEI